MNFCQQEQIHTAARVSSTSLPEGDNECAVPAYLTQAEMIRITVPNSHYGHGLFAKREMFL